MTKKELENQISDLESKLKSISEVEVLREIEKMKNEIKDLKSELSKFQRETAIMVEKVMKDVYGTRSSLYTHSHDVRYDNGSIGTAKQIGRYVESPWSWQDACVIDFLAYKRK